MGIIKDGIEIPSDSDILLDKWHLDAVEGLSKSEKPKMCLFNNTAKAIELLDKHIKRKSRICLHTDVDMDGIGTTYILKKALEVSGCTAPILLINKDKVHGILPKHADFFNQKKAVDLMIITDSSCNELETIKRFECDVLVVDHHEILHNDCCGKCNDGIHEYIIVNNTTDNFNQEYDVNWLKSNMITDLGEFNNLEQYHGTKEMSCGLVIYEFLRVYFTLKNMPTMLEDLMLYQWVGVTLFTDVIGTLNARNQWYMDQTVFNRDIEVSLKTMMQVLNRWKCTIDKSFIQFNLAPTINKTIRAGESSLALNTVINFPHKIGELLKFNEQQQSALEKATTVEVKSQDVSGNEVIARKPLVFSSSSYIALDISKFGISPNYSGVIASRLSGDNNKNAAIYIINEKGLCKGSFRGKYKSIDYRKYFADYSSDIYAQGHPEAFGFELRKDQLDDLMNNISSIEPQGIDKPWLTAGHMNPTEYGKYHVSSLDDFKKQGYIWRIATGNSKVTSKDEICIRVSANDVKLIKTEGKVFLYDALGLECKAFKPLQGNYFDIYMELTNELVMYIR
jgi:single-stranded DNA-specific DHH superfamily exonuclease